MTRKDVRRILSDLAGVDPEQDAGIEVQLHARTPGPRGTHTVTTVRMVDLTHALADLVERQSKEAVHRAQERAHRAEIKVTELQLAARKEREMAETTEQGETVSLHERLKATTDTFTDSTRPDETSYYRVRLDTITAIEQVIREDAIAPWRERVAELEWENGELKKVAVKLSKHCDDWMDHYATMKARADAICRVAKDVISNPSDYNISEMNRKIAAYDAADRAGETQEHKCVCTVPPESGMCDCMADQTAPSPTDATPKETWGQAKRRLAEWMSDYMMSSGMTDIKHPDHRAKLAWYLGCKETGTPIEDEYLIDPDPSPTDAAAEGEVPCEDPFADEEGEDDRFWRGSVDAAFADVAARLRALERWRADVDERMETDRRNRLRVLNQYANDTINRFAKNELRIVDLEQRLDAPSPDPESADWKDGWQAGHEAGYRSRQKIALRGPEVTVTEEMVQAYLDATAPEYLKMFSGTSVIYHSDIRKTARRGIEAALRAGGASDS